MAKANRTYHGWIVVESGGKDYKDYVYVEWQDPEMPGDRRKKEIGRGESGCATAVEWWDKKVGQNVKLEPAMRGCYRVYTEQGGAQ